MKISRNWIQTFFDAPLPDAQTLADALTFHAFEIENISDSKGNPWMFQGLPLDTDAVLDVKVTPNRGADSLSHRGSAKEISAILNIPMKSDPLREPMSGFTKSRHVEVSIGTPLCARYIAGYIKGVKVGPSPDWLRENLESIGQKSINNIVDAANFVMFNIGQPLHAFDASKLASKSEQSTANSEQFRIQIRNARKGEKITTLDNKEYPLSDSMLVIADGNADTAIGIAGVKGGKTAEVNEKTTDIILESANFDGVSIRKTAQALKLRTEASQRFEQSISPELAAFGMRAVTDLILKVAGGEIVGFVDQYPAHQERREVSVLLTQINEILGTKFTESEIAETFKRLGFPQCSEASPHCIFKVEVPFERLDISIPEDLVEEIARIVGYDKIPSTELPVLPNKPKVNNGFYSAERVREDLVSKGYSEVYTSVFAGIGKRQVLNKVGGGKSYLRANLVDGLTEALGRNIPNKDILGLKEVKLFEVGTIWPPSLNEEIAVATITEREGAKERTLELIDETVMYEDLPISNLKRYQSFSRYPFIVRDLSLWIPDSDEARGRLIIGIFGEYGAGLLRNVILFDQFKKDGRNSLAFHLVLQSFEKTLTDEEANAVMDNIYTAVKKEGWEVR